jgi:methyl-accepting chemotaxis protein
LVTSFILIDDRRKSIKEEIEAGTKVTVQLLESVALSRRPFLEGVDPVEGLAGFLRRAGRVRANEIRLYDQSDTLVYESPPSVYKQGRWAPEWFSRLMSPGDREFQLNMSFGYIVITPDSSRSVLDAWDELRRFGLILIIFFVSLNLAIFGLLGRAMRPLKGILSAMSLLEKGDLSIRLPDYKLPEFAAIGHTFNRMTTNLHDALAQNARLALVAQQSSDAILICDLEGMCPFGIHLLRDSLDFRQERFSVSQSKLLCLMMDSTYMSRCGIGYLNRAQLSITNAKDLRKVVQ